MNDDLGKVFGVVMTILAVGIASWAFFALTGPMNYYLETTKTAVASGNIYAGSGLEINTTSVDWGSVPPDSLTNTTVRVSNMLNDPMVLQLTTSNWDPENATEYMGLSWDDDGTPLIGRSYRDVVLTLTVYENVTGIDAFSFDITIGGI